MIDWRNFLERVYKANFLALLCEIFARSRV